MGDEKPFDVNEVGIKAEIDYWFVDSSRSDREFASSPDAAELLGQETLPAGSPTLLVFVGSPAAGKTTIRRERFQRGFVTVDAGDIFRRLEGERVLEFPGEMEELLNTIGQRVASRAVKEKRRIVTEVFDTGRLEALLTAFADKGYRTNMIGIRLDDVVEAQRRNLARGDHNISSYYTDDFNIRWLLKAIREQE